MYKYLYRKCLDDEVIRNAWKKLRDGKTERDDVIRIDNNFDYYVSKMKKMLLNTRPCDVDDPELAFVPPKHPAHIVYENGKRRIIYCPSIWEQWVHHIVIQVLSPIVMKYSYQYSCGSLPKRGSHYGKRQMNRLVKKKFRNFAKLDIRHFFNKIRLSIVLEMLRELISDEWFIHIIEVIFTHFPKGLPLGFYPSQWLANFVLWKMDRMIVSMEPDGFVRYMDDMVITDNNKKKLWRIIAAIKQCLGKMRMKLKDNYQVCKFHFVKKNGKEIGRDIDFMGFVFTPVSTVIRKHILIKATRCAKRIGKCERISLKQAQIMVSRCGWFKHTDTYDTWLEYIKPNVAVKKLKRIISIHQRRKNRENRMEKRNMSIRTRAVPACG